MPSLLSPPKHEWRLKQAGNETWYNPLSFLLSTWQNRCHSAWTASPSFTTDNIDAPMNDDKTFATRLNTNSANIEVAAFLQIELFYQGKLLVIPREDLPFYLGREEGINDMVMDGDTISRKHCVLQLRDHQIGLLDTSTNGTFVKPGRADSVFIHHEYYPLVGQGAIKLGHKIELDDPDLILYRVLNQ